MDFLPRNNRQLQKLLTDPLRNVANYVTQKIWNENRELVRQIVYEAGVPEYYERTNEFKDAWNIKESKNTLPTSWVTQYEFFYDWEKLTVDRSKSQHGSPSSVENYQDVRPYLADIIYQGWSGDLYGDGYWRKARDVWAKLLQSLGKRKMKQWFKQAFDYYNIDCESHMNVAMSTWDEI